MPVSTLPLRYLRVNFWRAAPAKGRPRRSHSSKPPHPAGNIRQTNCYTIKTPRLLYGLSFFPVGSTLLLIQYPPMEGTRLAFFLFFLSACFLVLTLGMFTVSKSAIHEIEALLYLLISSIFLCAGAILYRLTKLAGPQVLQTQHTARQSGERHSAPRSKSNVCPSCGIENVPTATVCDCGHALV